MEVLHGDNVPLNGDHTHFIMIDDGSRYRFFGKSTDFITRFETMVRDQEPMVKVSYTIQEPRQMKGQGTDDGAGGIGSRG